VSSAIIIVQSVLTLGTATVAFLALRLNKEQWRSTREPDLHLQILLGQQSGTTDMAIVNIGGWARGALFAMSVGDQRASSYLGDSFIAPGSASISIPNCLRVRTRGSSCSSEVWTRRAIAS
jgi:hypothetical protein